MSRNKEQSDQEAEELSPALKRQLQSPTFTEEEPGWCICAHDWEEHDFNDQCLDDDCDCEGYREY